MASFTTLKDFAAVPSAPEGMLPFLYPDDYDSCTLEEYKDWLSFAKLLKLLFIGKALYDGKILETAIITRKDATREFLREISNRPSEHLLEAVSILTRLKNLEVDAERATNVIRQYAREFHKINPSDCPHAIQKYLLSESITYQEFGIICDLMDKFIYHNINDANRLADVHDIKQGPSISLSKCTLWTYDKTIIARVFNEIVTAVHPPTGKVAFVGAGANPMYEDAIVDSMQAIDKSTVVYIDPLGQYKPPGANESVEQFASRSENTQAFSIIGCIRPYVTRDKQASFVAAVASMLCRGGCVIMYADESPGDGHVPQFNGNSSLRWRPVTRTDDWNVWIKE